MIKIHHIKSESLAEQAGLRVGDKILSINGEAIRDALDYQFCKSEAALEMVVERDGTPLDVFIERSFGEDWGLEPEVMKIKRCRNRCIFCFVHQNPPGMRKTLYVKDEDYRYSFMDGHFVTLSNMKAKDWSRILEMRLSPLYISVQCTNPDLRGRMLGNRKLEPVMERLEWLCKNEIKFHTQLVIVPEWNDGEELEKSVKDLISLHPSILSISLVPVGLTKFRENEPDIRGFTATDAEKVLIQAESLINWSIRQTGENLVFPSDELYLRAKSPIPSPSFYGDYDQFENGVGLLAAFKEDLEKTLPDLPRHKEFEPVTILTGKLAFAFQEEMMCLLKSETGLICEVIPCANHTFGDSVTVTGLLGGKDFLTGLKNSRFKGRVLIPPNSLNFEGLFIDNLSPEQLSKASGREILVPESFHNYYACSGN